VEDLKRLADITRHDLRDRMSPGTLRKQIQLGKVPHRRIGGRIYVEATVLEELLRGCEYPVKTSLERDAK
jgi:hypothetical protein